MQFIARRGKLLAVYAHNTEMHEDIVVLSAHADARLYIIDSRLVDEIAPIAAILSDIVVASDYNGFGWYERWSSDRCCPNLTHLHTASIQYKFAPGLKSHTEIDEYIASLKEVRFSDPGVMRTDFNLDAVSRSTDTMQGIPKIIEINSRVCGPAMNGENMHNQHFNG